MTPKVIRNETEYREALQRVDELFEAAPGTPEADELETWAILVDSYEEVHYPVPPPDPVEAIRFAMDQRGLRPVDLAPCLGGRSRVSEVLNGKRSLSISMITALWREFEIPLESLMPTGPKERQSRPAGR